LSSRSPQLGMRGATMRSTFRIMCMVISV
jgi:hypothetical protein